MRLICPNCGAHYEIPDDVIPEPGRDVQCSSCGDTWFQLHPSSADHTGEARGAETDDTGGHDWAEVEEDETAGEETGEEAALAPGAKRRELDPDVANVLREEASREAQARAAESGSGLETQPELGLSQDDGDSRSHQARARIARLDGMATSEDLPEKEDDIGPGTRRNLLPDIEEINSSITSPPGAKAEDSSARDGTRAETQETTRPGGFRRGMLLSVGLALAATAAYIFAPQIADTAPALSDPLAAYIDTVNEGRIALNGHVDGILAQLRALTGG